MKTRKLNKKAKLFSFGLAITLLIVLLRVYFLVTARKQDLSGQFSIGSNQLKIFEAIQQGEKAMLYGEEGFGMAFQQSLYEIAVSGGQSQGNICGNFQGLFLWRKNSTVECYPSLEDVKNEISEMTINSLKTDYLPNNPYFDSKRSDKTNYEMFLQQKGDKLIARAYALNPSLQRIICNYGKPPAFIFDWVMQPNLFGVPLPGYGTKTKVTITDIFAEDIEGTCGLYSYRPSFRKEVKFDINDFKTAAEQAKQFASDVETCKEKKSVRRCVDENLGKYQKISKDCAEGVSRVFSNFVNSYVSHLKSPKTDCVAFFSPPQLIDVDEKTEIRIRIISEGGKTHITVQDLGFSQLVDAAGPYFTEEYNDPENPSYIPSNKEIQYVLTYDENGKLKNKELNLGDGAWYSIDWDLAGNLMMHKEAANKLVFIDTDDYGEFDEVKFCMPQMEEVFSFCYDTGKKAMAYDTGTKSLGLQSLKINFALSFP